MAQQLKLGTLGIHLQATGMSSFSRSFDGATAKVHSLGATVKSVAAVSAKSLATIGAAGTYMVKVASDAKELQNVIQKSFGSSSSSINDWATQTAKAMQRSNYQMREFVGTAQAMLKPTLRNDQAAQEMSKSITKLAVDFASFRNISDRRAFDVITAGIFGETEGLKRLGFNLQDAALKDYLLRKGITKSTETMVAHEKVQHRYRMLMELMSDVHGDAADTAGELANSMKGLFARVRNISEMFGGKLYPAVNKAANSINSVLDRFTALDQKVIDNIFRFGVITSGILATAVGLGVLVTASNLAIKGIGMLSAVSAGLIPIVVIGAGVAAVGGAVYRAWDANWMGIADTVTGAFSSIKDWWDSSNLKDSMESSISELRSIWTDSSLDLGTKTISTLKVGVGTLQAIAVDALEIGERLSLSVLEFAVTKLKPVAVAALDFTAVNANLLQSGLNVIVGLSLAKNAGALILGQISRAFAAFSSGLGGLGGLGSVSGGAATIAVLSVGITLAKAYKTGDISGLATELVTALTLALVTAGLTKSPTAGALAFSVALNFELGKVVTKGVMKPVADAVFGKPGFEANQSYMEAFNQPIVPATGTVLRSAPKSSGFMDFFNFLGFHDGGLLPGKSGGDRFPALLAPGEAVVPSAAVNGGVDGVLTWFRKMGVPGFKTGKVPKITGNFGSDLAGTTNYLSGITSAISNISRVLTKSFELVGLFIVKLAEKIFGEENTRDLLDTFKGIRDLFTGQQASQRSGIGWASRSSSERGNYVMPPAFLERLSSKLSEAVSIGMDTANRLSGQMFASAPIAQDVVSGFSTGGVAGALTALVANSETFGQLMGNINPILQGVADMLGMVLEPLLPLANVLMTALLPIFSALGKVLSALIEPVFRILFPILKGVGIAATWLGEMFVRVIGYLLEGTAWYLRGIGEGLNKIWDGLGDSLIGFADALGGIADGLFESADDLKKSREDLIGLTYDEAKSRAKNTEGINRANAALRNIPQSFKLAQRRLDVTSERTAQLFKGAQTSSSTQSAQNQATNAITININRPVYGIADLEGIIKNTMNEYDNSKKQKLLGV